jgi:hypothetical protein
MVDSDRQIELIFPDVDVKVRSRVNLRVHFCDFLLSLLNQDQSLLYKLVDQQAHHNSGKARSNHRRMMLVFFIDSPLERLLELV